MEKSEILKLMDKTMEYVNEEDIWESWITYGIPNGAEEEEFEEFAEDFEEFEKVFKDLLFYAKKYAEEENQDIFINETPNEILEFAKNYI